MSNSTHCNSLLAAKITHRILDDVKSEITNSQLQIAMSKHLALLDTCSSYTDMLSKYEIGNIFVLNLT